MRRQGNPRFCTAALPCVFACGVLLIAACAQAGPAADGSGGQAARASQADGLVEWLDQPRATATKQTDAQEEAGRQHGRALPEAEILQPTIDSTLPVYRPRKDLKLRGSYKGAASDVLPGLANAWAAAFHKIYPNVSLTISPPFAGSLGAKELVAQKIDFVFVSRELKPDDVTGFQAKFGYPPLSVPVSGGSYRHFGFLDAVGFFVSKQNPLEKISFDQLDAVLSSTHYRGGTPITTWGQLGLTGDWADKPIHVYAIKPWNGFEEFVRQRVLSVGDRRGEWRDDIHFDKLVFPLAGQAVDDRYALGYTGIAYVDAPVRMLALADRTGGEYFAPSYENVARATYPLARLIYFNTNKAPGRPLAPALNEFLRFILSRDGQQIVRDQAVYLPLRESQAAAARALIEH